MEDGGRDKNDVDTRLGMTKIGLEWLRFTGLLDRKLRREKEGSSLKPLMRMWYCIWIVHFFCELGGNGKFHLLLPSCLWEFVMVATVNEYCRVQCIFRTHITKSGLNYLDDSIYVYVQHCDSTCNKMFFLVICDRSLWITPQGKIHSL